MELRSHDQRKIKKATGVKSNAGSHRSSDYSLDNDMRFETMSNHRLKSDPYLSSD